MAKKSFNLPFLNRVTLREKVFLARQLATMLGSGLAIDQSLKVILLQTRNKVLAAAYQQIIHDLEQGNSLSFALSKYPNIFDPVFIAIVRAGESSGKIDKVLLQLAERLEQSQDFNNKVRSAMMYPIFVIVTMIAIIILMMIFVIPQLKSVFDDLDVDLPWTTRTIVWISNFTVNYWYVEVIIAVAILVAGYFFFRSERGGSVWDRAKIKLPYLKDLYVEIYMARFCRTMSMLIASGVPIMETIAITADVIQNRIYTQSLKTCAAQVERGIPMSVPLEKDKNFPIIVPQMILVGEQTGKMETVLTKLADFFERETDAMIKGMAGLIEPALIIIIGLGVGFLVYAIIYPIYSIAQIGF